MVIHGDIFHNPDIMLVFYVTDNRLDNLAAVCGMQLHFLKLLRCKFTGLLENGIRHLNLSHIMERRRLT